MQNAVVNIPNGARCSKLWPNTNVLCVPDVPGVPCVPCVPCVLCVHCVPWDLGFGIWYFSPIQPEMVFGCNLQHMAPFGMLTTAFCMVFQGATLIFSAPGARFWAQGQILAPGPGPGPKIGARAPNLESKLGLGPFGPLGPQALLGPLGPFGPKGPLWAHWALGGVPDKPRSHGVYS